MKNLHYMQWPVWISHTCCWVTERKESEVAQLCLTLYDPLDCSLPGSSAHWIFQASIPEWLAISFPRIWIFPTQGSNLGLLHYRQILYQLNHHWSPVKVKVTQSCLTLCNPMDCIVHGFLQARILEWVVFPFSRGSSQPRDQTGVSCIAGGFFTNWASGKPRVIPERGHDVDCT